MFQWFLRMKIGSKLYLAFGAMVLFAGFIAYRGFNALEAEHLLLARMYERNALAVAHVREADWALVERARMVRNAVIEGFLKSGQVGKWADGHTKYGKVWDREWAAFAHAVEGGENKKSITDIEQLAATLSQREDAIIDTARKGDPTSAAAGLDDVRDLATKIDDDIETLSTSTFQEMESEMNRSNDTYQASRTTFVWSVGGALAAALALALLLTRVIATPIARLVPIFRRIANGELRYATQELAGFGGSSTDGRAHDEVRELVVAAGEMTAGLTAVAKSLHEGVAQISSSATQINATTKEHATTTAEQAASIVEITTTVEEIKQTSQAAASSAREVSDGAERASMDGQSGRERLVETVDIIQGVNERVQGIAAQILRLAEQTGQIRGIVETVNDLAEQSNLLAVNASIEAAKAGEQGRGFSVVASEVRSLADQSKRATQQIQNILLDIQKATQGAVMAAEEGTKRTEDGRRAVESVNKVVGALSNALEDSSSKARQIAGASAQQASGIAQIAQAMASISAAGRDTTEGVKQLERAVDDMQRVAKDLKKQSERFAV